MADFIVSAGVFEPEAFFDPAMRAVHVHFNLDVQDIDPARPHYEEFLAALPDARFFLYRYLPAAGGAAARLTLESDEFLQAEGPAPTEELASPIVEWIQKRVDEESAQWTAALPQGEIVDYRKLSASQVLASSESWHAPLAQVAGLSRILAAPAAAGAGPWVVLAYFGNAVAEEVIEPVTERTAPDGQKEFSFVYVAGLFAEGEGELPEVNGRARPIATFAEDATSLIDPTTGFLVVRSGTGEVHTALKRIREHSASLLWTGPQLIGLDWAGAVGAPDRMRILKRLMWRGLNGLVVLLDPGVTALTMGGRPREGPFAAALKAMIETISIEGASFPLDATGVEGWITSAVSEGVKPPAANDAPARRAYAALLARLFGIEAMLGFPPASDISAPMKVGEIPRLLPFLLTLYASYGSAEAVPTEIFDPGAARARFGESLDGALDIELGELVQRVESEQGIEALVLDLLTRLGCDGPALGRFLNRTEAQLPDPEQDGSHIFAEFERLLADNFNGLDAARFAQGSLFEAAIAARRPGNVPVDLRAIEAALKAGEWFAARLDLLSAEHAQRNPLAVLARALPLLVGKDSIHADDRTWLARLTAGNPGRLVGAYAQVRSELLGGTASLSAGRFVPDSVPQPLPVRIAVDHDLADMDAFAAHFDGIALLIRRDATGGGGPQEEWTYASLAWLTRSGGYGDALTIHPLHPAAVDGQRMLFLEYVGDPLASRAGATGAQEPLSAFYGYDSPTRAQLDADGKKPLPALAYGHDYEVAAHVVGRSGALPRDMQLLLPTPVGPPQRVPWLPAPTPPTPAARFVERFAYRRTTAIGRATITGDEQRFGGAIEGVQPLCQDYPRLGFQAPAGGTGVADLWRGADRAGALALPEAEDEDAAVAVADIRGFGIGRLKISVMGDLPGGVDEATAKSWSFAVAGPFDHGSLAISVDRSGSLWRFGVVVGAGAGLTLIGSPTFEVEAPADHKGGSVWLRLRLDADQGGPLSLSYSDPRPQMTGTSASGQGIESVVLLAPDRGDVWKPGIGEGATAKIAFPRMGYEDFDRWLNNVALFTRAAGDDVEKAKLGELRAQLLGARLAGAPGEQMWSRIPDLAVDNLLVELTPLDALRPADAVRPLLSDRLSMVVPMPRYGKWLRDKTVSDLVSRQLLHRERDKDDDGHHATLSVMAGAELEIRLDGNHRKWIATVPAGMVASLKVRPMVAIGHFGAEDGRGAVLDPRLRQLAVGERDGHLLFDGPALTIEVMQTLMAPVDEGGRASTWPVFAESMVDLLPAGAQRRYDLAVKARRLSAATAPWRQLGIVDVRTQRWRFLGRPIRNWFDPAAARLTGEAAEGDTGTPFIRLDPGNANLERFEREAFLGRDDQDADTLSVKLRPLPLADDGGAGSASTILQTVPWEPPSATMFRHRLVGRSRYAGAMRSAASAEAPLQPLDGEDNLGQWIRVVMLADRTRLQLTRPQLRALLPLTVPPEGMGAPPILALLEEHPFAHGGLADRIGAEIRTGFGYDLPDENLEIKDSRKEFGPDPRLDYFATPETLALAIALVPEGPIGLTFDSDAAPAPAFVNTAMVLSPAFTTASVRAKNPNLEEHFLSVALRRYLDHRWTVSREPPIALPGKISAVEPWWIQWQARPEESFKLSCLFRPAEGEPAAIDACTIEKVETGSWEVKVNPKAVLPTATDVAPRIVAVADAGAGAFALLHQPLEDGRSALSVFLIGSGATRGGGVDGGALPLMLASFEWTVSKPGEKAVPEWLAVEGTGSAFQVSASPTTLMNWTRTGRNFDVVGLAGHDGVLAQAAVSDLAVVGAAPNRRGNLVWRGELIPVWPRPMLSAQPNPLFVHRHLGMIVTREAKGLGRSLEIYERASLLTGIALPKLPGSATNRRVRLIELEMPAQPIGGRTVMEAFRKAVFDLRAIGKDMIPIEGFLFCIRPLGAARKVSAGWSMKMTIGPHGAESSQTAIKLALATAVPEFEAAMVMVVLAPESQNMPGAAILIDSKGGEHPLRPAPPLGPAHPLRLAELDGEALQVADFDMPSEGAAESWADISMLTLRKDLWPSIDASRAIVEIPLSFDWLFTGTDRTALDAVTSDQLGAAYEAQARIITVSLPIPVKNGV